VPTIVFHQKINSATRSLNEFISLHNLLSGHLWDHRLNDDAIFSM
jgi:hypothetical protein